MILSCLFINDSPKRGRGVFTREIIQRDRIVEISPVIIMSGEERKLLDQTRLHDYIFEWGKDRSQICMAMGYVPVYNHSFRSNCEYEMNFEEETILIRTMRKIEAGEELFINYNGNWNDETPLWFKAT